ncbi:MAG TPA: hypothetical protein VMU34_11820 [Mycobacterium sp.]|nr:hypothetical protein [Mycobacterium sp.]
MDTESVGQTLDDVVAWALARPGTDWLGPRAAFNLRFLLWLDAFGQRLARVVKLGCWLGAVTACLAEGLRTNPVGSPQVTVFDAFVWHDWMDGHRDHPTLRGSAARGRRRPARPVPALLPPVRGPVDRPPWGGGQRWRGVRGRPRNLLGRPTDWAAGEPTSGTTTTSPSGSGTCSRQRSCRGRRSW